MHRLVLSSESEHSPKFLSGEFFIYSKYGICIVQAWVGKVLFQELLVVLMFWPGPLLFLLFIAILNAYMFTAITLGQ